MFFAAYGLAMSAILGLVVWQMQDPGRFAILITAVKICAGLLIGGYGVIRFRRWRANAWNPNDGDPTEQRELGRKLAFIKNQSHPDEAVALLASADQAQERRIRRLHANGARWKAFGAGWLALVGGGLLTYESRLIATAVESSSWPHVLGKLQSARVASERRGKRFYYWPEVEYDYEADGAKFRGTQYCLGKDDSILEANAAAVVNRLKAAPDVAVYYNPRSPEESFLRLGLPFWKLMTIGFADARDSGNRMLNLHSLRAFHEAFASGIAEIVARRKSQIHGWPKTNVH